MDSMKDEDGQGGVPVGMSRATWERVIEVCEAAIEEGASRSPTPRSSRSNATTSSSASQRVAAR